jgi:hypothetical protein
MELKRNCCRASRDLVVPERNLQTPGRDGH